MGQIAVILVLLVLAVAICLSVIASYLRELTGELASLNASLMTEFNKEKEYYKEARRSEERYQEWQKETHGWGPVESMPMPPDAPGVISVAEMLREINRNVAYLRPLAESVNKLVGTN